MSALRVGLLGTGLAPTKLYLPAFAALRGRLEVVACANRTRKKAEAYARLARIPKVVDDAAALIALPEVEALVISLPIDAQPRYVLEALRAGKPVLSEKPVGPSVAAARRLVRAAKRHDVPWLVGENFAFMPHVEKLARWVKSGRLGDVRVVEATQMTRMDAKNPYFHTSWREKPGHVGGFVADAGVHVACALRRALELPSRVENLTASFEPSLVPLDTVVAALGFPSGAVGTWTSCFSVPYRGPLLRLFGSRATAELHYDRACLLKESGKVTTFEARTNSFEAEFRHFVEVARGRRPVGYTPDEGLLDLALLERLVGPA